jgi:hypothetical protein
MVMGGSWSVYWYNGAIVSSEIARGMDVAELVPSQYISQNEIDAAKTVRWTTSTRRGSRRSSGRRRSRWPVRTWTSSSATSASASRIASVRQALSTAEKGSGGARNTALSTLSSQLAGEASSSCDSGRVQKLSQAVKDLAVTS